MFLPFGFLLLTGTVFHGPRRPRFFFQRGLRGPCKTVLVKCEFSKGRNGPPKKGKSFGLLRFTKISFFGRSVFALRKFAFDQDRFSRTPQAPLEKKPGSAGSVKNGPGQMRKNEGQKRTAQKRKVLWSYCDSQKFPFLGGPFLPFVFSHLTRTVFHGPRRPR
jgi:hypothetical protein